MKQTEITASGASVKILRIFLAKPLDIFIKRNKKKILIKITNDVNPSAPNTTL